MDCVLKEGKLSFKAYVYLCCELVHLVFIALASVEADFMNLKCVLRKGN